MVRDPDGFENGGASWVPDTRQGAFRKDVGGGALKGRGGAVAKEKTGKHWSCGSGSRIGARDDAGGSGGEKKCPRKDA